ncbi:uncharacterized protein Z518_00276 [Rhinocladiella mackenziei CBS 650.93]|uniref:BTB domain-containing protein n=1 Tax=Rhinocladiella mackenziei CBS 650.93 TaxID=1442369 RepID=A0A0D2G3M2_9EURO|nr:uncharacterized protein Z518_00276 [Rhinocladiella mackenziei CBS 650.93]KIX09197.1 hypothetical protein Z518_00276 [Rhinocladiella mackenziei CBS 650.93]
MAIPYPSFVNSYPFEFLIGPAKRSFYVHSGLIKQHSETLAALVEGGMAESRERCAHLEDMEEDTFIHFLEFAYTGDYSVSNIGVTFPSADTILYGPVCGSGQVAAGSGTADSAEEWGLLVKKTRKSWKSKSAKIKSGWYDENGIESPLPEDEDIPVKAEPDVDMSFEPLSRNPSRHTDLWRLFKSKARVSEMPPWEPRANMDHCEDYTTLFLCHAKLYVFSDRYIIKALQELVLQKLRLTLSRFTLFRERTGDIVKLLKYTYANTMDYDDGIDKLRSLVSDYVVCHVETIVKDEEFLNFLQEEGAMAKDLVLKLLQRLT